MASNAAKAAGRVVGAMMRGDAVKVDEATFAKRMEACRTCPRVIVRNMHGRDWLRCSACGCWLDAVSFAKARLATETCPEGRWP